MINQSTVEVLRKMRLSSMAQSFEEQINDPNTYTNLSFEERIGLMVDAEWAKRQSNKLNKSIQLAPFLNNSLHPSDEMVF